MPGENGVSPEKKRLNRWLVVIARVPVRLYKLLVSPLLPQSCRFEPTCSAYALQALEKHGVIRGGWLTVGRLLRCQPWSHRHGHDPVP